MTHFDRAAAPPDRALRSYAIRRAGLADAGPWSRLAAALFTQTFGAANRAADMDAYMTTAFGEARQRAELADSSNAVWLAEDARGHLLGYAHVRFPSAPQVPAGVRPAELARIYADRDAHGSGLGAALLAACVDHALASGADALWLGVWERNPRAIAFYEKHGFRVAGEQAFRLGEDEQRDLVMVRVLTGS